MLIAFHWSCTGLEEVLWGFYRGLKFGDLRMAPGSEDFVSKARSTLLGVISVCTNGHVT